MRAAVGVKRRAPWIWLAAGLGLGACREGARPAEPRYRVEPVGLELPKLPGWIDDPSAVLTDEAAGGTALRLNREGAVPGSPRIEVILEPKSPRPITLDTHLEKSLRQMASLEDAGQIRITEVEQRPASVGPRRGYRVRHAYTMGKGAEQISVTQIATLLVLDGRGVTVLAYGRTELFHPLADAVEQVMASMSTPADGGAGSGVLTPTPVTPTPVTPMPVTPVPVSPGPQRPTPVEPIDLGKVGGPK